MVEWVFPTFFCGFSIFILSSFHFNFSSFIFHLSSSYVISSRRLILTQHASRVWYRSRLRREINQKLVTKIIQNSAIGRSFKTSFFPFFSLFVKRLRFFASFLNALNVNYLFFSSFFIILFYYSMPLPCIFQIRRKIKKAEKEDIKIWKSAKALTKRVKKFGWMSVPNILLRLFHFHFVIFSF